ncbi:hypothetical protein Dsin_005515 [Dipteronia sinensis]|uniref:Cytochrome P450 n=1 Tax=Dipteronia sinensis TaxID=43782 RepID=A0AAE0EEP2_9ROSI|nr:hypothetical protein Dsin_005515 [Dipteronia sinensis]
MALQSVLKQFLSQLVTPVELLDYNTLFLCLLFVLPLVLLLFKQYLLKSEKLINLPPSPPKLPIIGNLHQLGTLPHRSLRALADKYGPLMLLRLGGSSSTLVVSSAEMASDLVKTHDIVFSNRPKTTATNIFLYGCRDVAFAPYGEYWRHARKICVLELLSMKRVQSFTYVREEEVEILLNKIRLSCFDGGIVDLTVMLEAVVNTVVARCVLGRKAEEENGPGKFGVLSRRATLLMTAICFGDVFPSLAWLDVVTGYIGRINTTFKAIDALFDQVIEEHRTSIGDDVDDQFDKKDFVHILLQLQKDGMFEIDLTQNDIKAILMDMFVAGTDTTSTTLEWSMAELVRHPNIMKKAQEEVRSVMKNKLKMDMNDMNEMNYLKCVIKETLRLHPPIPLLLPRETSTITKLGGYDIPEKTRVFVNAWAIQRDPKLWDRPEEFIPERHVNNPIDYKGLDFHLIPFGVGRRGCPGISFGVATVEYTLANILYWFDWKLPGGAIDNDKLDMTEVYGTKKFPLRLVPALYSP